MVSGQRSVGVDCWPVSSLFNHVFTNRIWPHIRLDIYKFESLEYFHLIPDASLSNKTANENSTEKSPSPGFEPTVWPCGTACGRVLRWWWSRPPVSNMSPYCRNRWHRDIYRDVGRSAERAEGGERGGTGYWCGQEIRHTLYGVRGQVNYFHATPIGEGASHGNNPTARLPGKRTTDYETLAQIHLLEPCFFAWTVKVCVHAEIFLIWEEGPQSCFIARSLNRLNLRQDGQIQTATRALPS